MGGRKNMRKKILGILMMMLLIVSGFPTLVSGNDDVELNNEYSCIRQEDMIITLLDILTRTSEIQSYTKNICTYQDYLFCQQPMPGTEGWVTYTSSSDAGYLSQDDFWDLTEDIFGIQWWGLSLSYDPWTCCDPTGMEFEVIFYQDSGGMPGSIVETISGLKPTAIDTGDTYNLYTVYTWQIYLLSAVSLTDGWVSIQSTYSPNGCWFLWVNSPDGNRNLVQNDVQIEDNLAFCLIGQDITPPITSKNVGKPNYLDEYYITSETEISLTATDNPGGSGVKSIYYRVVEEGSSPGPWILYTSPFTIPGDGVYYVEYFAEDNAGNKEEIQHDSHCVDNEPPNTCTEVIGYPFYLDENPLLGKHLRLPKGAKKKTKKKEPQHGATITVYDDEDGKKKIKKEVGPAGKKRKRDGHILVKENDYIIVKNDRDVPIKKKVYYNGKLKSEVWIQPGDSVKQIVGEDLPCKGGAIEYYDVRDPPDEIIETHMYPVEAEDDYGLEFDVQEPYYNEGYYSTINYEDSCYSGVSYTFYRIWYNGAWGPWRTSIDPAEELEFVFNDLGLHYLEYYTIDNLGNKEEINNETIFVEEEFYAPTKPTKPAGPPSGKINEEYTYTTSSTDLDGDQLYYVFKWGDETETDWLGPYPSGGICTASHIWTEEGTYNITVIARDEHYCFSEWSDLLAVGMPKSRAINTLFYNFLQNHPILYHLLQRLLKL
jgi:hypothetical protein